MAFGNQANVKAVITADDRASATLNKFGSNVNSVGQKITRTMKAAGLAATAAIGVTLARNLDDAVKRLDTLNNSVRTFENMGFEAKEVNKAMKALNDSILGLPTPLDAAVRGMTTITASINDIDKGQKIFTALNNAVLGFGGTTEMVDNAVLQLSQDMGTGRITAQTWLSLMNSGLTPALAAMSRQMGITTKELKAGLSDGTVSVDQFIDTLIKMDKEGGGGLKSFEQIARDSTKGIQSSWANMNTAIARGLANILQAIGRDRLSGIIISAGQAIEGALNKLIELGPHLNKLAAFITTNVVPSIKLFADAVNADITPRIRELAAFVQNETIPALLNFWSTNKDVIIPILKALGWVIQNVVINLLRQMINTMNAVVRTGTFMANAFTTIRNRINGAIASIKNTFNGLPGPVRAAAGAIVSGLTPVLSIMRAIISNARQIAGSIDTVISKGNQLRNSTAGRIAEGAFNLSGPGLLKRASGLLPQFAGGTSFAPGGVATVGERGPEQVVLPRGSQVVPNNSTRQSGNTISLSVNVGVYTGSEIEKRKLAKTMLKSLQDMASSQGMSVGELLGT